MKVSIVEINTGKEVCRYELALGSLNDNTSEQENFSEAWKCAVEDRVVNAGDRDKYRLSLVNSELP